jgi:phosphonate transport system substrate-binding protein
MMKAFIAIFFVTVVFSFARCKNKAALNDDGVPQTLIIAAFGGESPDQMRLMYVPVSKYLEKKLGMPVELILTNDYVASIEALKTKKVHMAYLGPFGYVIASRSVPLTPIIVMGVEGKPYMYHSTIIVNGHSNLNSMADVKAHSKNLSFCFVDPASTSGHLIPRAYLTSIGLNPDTAFKQTIFAGSHAASLLTVKSGKVDVGCVQNVTVTLLTQKGLIKPGDIRTIWVSPPIVGDPIVVRNDLNKAFVKKIQDAYLDMGRDAPQILKNYMKIYAGDTLKRSFIVAQDSMYNGLRRIANKIKDLKAN